MNSTDQNLRAALNFTALRMHGLVITLALICLTGYAKWLALNAICVFGVRLIIDHELSGEVVRSRILENRAFAS